MPISTSQQFVVCTIKSWNLQLFEEMTPEFDGDWHLVSDKNHLTVDFLQSIKPRYVFFPHWSWIVPESILEQFECVCFHMTDVPYGRGGSPLQNLIARGHASTKLTALKMTSEIDAGPVYGKQDLELDGTAAEILKRAGKLSLEMANMISKTQPEPVAQTGKVTHFQRRTAEMSLLPEHYCTEKLYDHIRMLDGEGYPLAFLEHGDHRLEFSNATMSENGTLSAQVIFRSKTGKNK